MRYALLVLILFAGCWSAPAPAPDRIVLITIDTLRADRLGAYGDRAAHTPNLDTVARRGVRFEVALSPAPLTLPAHASLLTGVDPPTHGVRHNSVHRLGDDLPTLAERLRGAGYTTAAFVGAMVLDRRFGLARGFDVYDDHTAGRVSGVTGYAERPANAVVDAVLRWLETAPDRFFLWVHFYDPHMDYLPPPGFRSAFASDPYAGEIAFVDAELGRLLGALEQRYGTQGTLVIATSDHGESLGEHGEWTHSYTVYDATQRIPLLLAGAGLPEGHVAPGPASLLDVAPTLLAWVGAPALPGADGRDLRILLRGESPDPRVLYMETLAPQLDFGWSPLLAVRTGRFKYVRAPRPELYDLHEDPGEVHDLAAQEPERVAELDALVAARTRGARPSEAVRLGAGDRERLRSLGYVVPEAAAPGTELGRVGGPDPKDRIGLLSELARAESDLREGRAAAALARLDALPERGPHVTLYRAAAALASGDAGRAEREARAALAAEPSRTDARVLLARALDAQERRAEADRVLAALPPDVAPAPWVVQRAARVERAAGMHAAAAERLARARERFPGDARLAQAARAAAAAVESAPGDAAAPPR